jgi:cysteine synthase A
MGILDCIGNTPLIKLEVINPYRGVNILAKLEGNNPGGSVKDRIASYMVKDAEEAGTLKKGDTILEATSGNTGIGLAMVGAAKGYKVKLVMPECVSLERRKILEALGAELVLSPGNEGTDGAIKLAHRIMGESHNGYFMPDQFENHSNPDMHRRTTALEIIGALDDTVPDALVAGVGTGGTITGVGEIFRQRRPDVLICAVEPAGSPILSGGNPGPHRIAGIGAGFYPGILNTKIYNEVIPVTDEDAEMTARELSLKEGILAGISSGAAGWAAIKIALRLGSGKRVVVILPDRGDRYLSTGVFFPMRDRAPFTAEKLFE